MGDAAAADHFSRLNFGLVRSLVVFRGFRPFFAFISRRISPGRGISRCSCFYDVLIVKYLWFAWSLAGSGVMKRYIQQGFPLLLK